MLIGVSLPQSAAATWTGGTGFNHFLKHTSTSWCICRLVNLCSTSGMCSTAPSVYADQCISMAIRACVQTILKSEIPCPEICQAEALKSAGLRKLLHQLLKHLCKSACVVVLGDVSRTADGDYIWLFTLCTSGKQYQCTEASTRQQRSRHSNVSREALKEDDHCQEAGL